MSVGRVASVFFARALARGARIVGVALATLAIAACTQRTPADLLLYDGKVITLDDASTIATTVVVTDGRIVAVGGDEIRKQYDAKDALDLGGRALLPGFIDTHIHADGHPKRYVELGGAKSIDEVVKLVAAKAAELGPSQWITGANWSEDQLAEKRRPLVADLDRAAPQNPVVLTRAGAHSVACNSLALALAGLSPKSKDPDHGAIERDERGILNGIIRERGDIVTRLVPQAPADELDASLVETLRGLFALGITSLIQAADTIDHYPAWQRIYAAHPGELPRAAVQVRWEGPDKMTAFGRKSGDGDEYLRVGAIKVFIDGGFTGPAAYTKEPYKGMGDYRGMLTMPEADLRRTIREAHDAGWQIGIHAIGDAAIELAVDALDQALKATPRDDHRHYLNHFTLLPSDATLDLMAQDKILITEQPNFTYTLEGRYVAYLDGDRLQHNNALRTPRQHGIFTALSSDDLPIGPLVGLYAAVTRRGMSGAVYGADERLSIDEALRGYTRSGAYFTREEAKKGSIEVGKLADLIELSQDPLTSPPEALLTMQVERTYLGGKLVFDRAAQKRS